MSDKSRARAVQRKSGWPYQKCLEWVKLHKPIILKWSVQMGVSNSQAAAKLWVVTEGKPSVRDVLS